MILKGQITRISPHGIQLNGSNTWNNFLREIKQDLHTSALSLYRKFVVIELNENGSITKVSFDKDYKYKKGSLLVKVIESNTAVAFESALNTFGNDNRVIATQTHITDNKFIGVLFYTN